MVVLNKGQIPPLLAERIRRWLGSEGSQEFAQWLRTMSAIKTAEAGNQLNEPGQSEIEARALAADADFYHRVADLMQECRMPDKTFDTIEITPVPVTNTPTQD